MRYFLFATASSCFCLWGTTVSAQPLTPPGIPAVQPVPPAAIQLEVKPESKPAEEKKTETKPADPVNEKPAVDKPAGDPDTITLVLLDGSVIAGKLSLKDLEVETQFGKLTVPVVNLRSFTPGIGSHPELSSSLQTYIKNLGSPIFNDREAAQKAIVKIGPTSRYELQKFVDDTDTERRTRVKAILEEFDTAADDEDAPKTPAVNLRDTIETSDFTIVGKIGHSSFEVKTLYGPLSVKLSDIQRAYRMVPQKESVQKSFTVDGGAIAQRAMKSTGVKLEKGDKVTITAEGSIVMTPWGNQAMATPEGAANYGWYIPNQIAAGALVARIGNNGPIFKIGSKHSFTADRAGVLNLGIGMEPSYVNNNFPGDYRTKIRVEKK